jgi:hypothetical protein
MAERRTPLGVNPRTAGQVRSWEIDPSRDWTWDAHGLRVYGWELYQTAAPARALIESRVSLTFGAAGLQFRAGGHGGSPAEAAAARAAEKWLRPLTGPRGRSFSACGQWNIHDQARLAEVSCIVTGGGWLVRLYRRGRPGALRGTGTHWREVADERVRTPADLGGDHGHLYEGPVRIERENRHGIPVGREIWQGLELLDGQVVGILVAHPEPGVPLAQAAKYTRYPCYDRHGEPALVHRQSPQRVGQLRGLSELSPTLGQLRSLNGVTEAHVVAKRAQAGRVGHLKTDDEETLAAFRASGAGVGPHIDARAGSFVAIRGEEELHDAQVNYEGSDFTAFCEAIARNISSAWCLPWRWVLAHIDGVSMASGRVFVSQAHRRAEEWQDAVASQTYYPLIRSHFREGIALGTIPRSADLDLLMDGDYLRPPRLEIDPKGSAAAAEAWRRLGKSLRTIHRNSGGDYDRERQLAADEPAIGADGEAIDDEDDEDDDV